MKNPLKVAVAQMNSSDRVEENQAQVMELLQSITEPVDLVVFPENSLFFRISSASPQFCMGLDSELLQPLQNWVEKTGAQLILGSVPSDLPQGVGNSMLRLRAGEAPEWLYHKIHLFDVDVPGAKPVRESDQFVHGDAPALFDVHGWKVAASICYDMRFSELYWHYALKEADLILAPSAFLVPTGQAHWHVLLRARAIESQAYVVAPAQCGDHVGEGGARRESYGHSLIVDPWGKLLVDLESQGPRVRWASLDHGLRQKIRQQIPMHQHRSWTP